MKFLTRGISIYILTKTIALRKTSAVKLSCLLTAFLLLCANPLTALAYKAPAVGISGKVTDEKNEGLANVSIQEKGTSNGVVTNPDGTFSITVANSSAVLVFTYVGFVTQEVAVKNQTTVNVQLVSAASNLNDVVVIGYGTQKKGSVTSAISTVTSKDLDRVHGGSTVSSGLAGKIPGVTFRMPDGRPGASATIQIRNMGNPLYVIDGIQQDAGQFNNIAPNDIESISVLKDASAAIYGVRAANGVIVVTTKRGASGKNNVNIDAYAGWQTWFRFPEVLNSSYDYMFYRAEAEINRFGNTNITQEELDKYKQGESAGKQYRSFDWREYILDKPAPQNSVNINISGGSDKVNYYVSATNFYQNSNLGKEYRFNRSNIQANVTAKLATGFKVGAELNGRVETRQNPGVPGGDDYWLSRFAILRNTPRERPYANDNPAYLNDMGEHLETNYAFLNETISGKLKNEWRVVQANLNAEWAIPFVQGLTVKGTYSYYIADLQHNNQEYTYKAYTYIPATETAPEEYRATGGSTNPWRDREQIKQINKNMQVQLNYNNTFGDHSIGATLVAERLEFHRRRNWLHASPISNNLPLIYFPTMDQYQDEETKERRLGYIGRLTYSFANRYFVEASARRDASYLFAPGQRIGYFPGVSVGWRLTEEPFFKNLLGDSRALSDLKLRASYGQLGDDRNPYDQNQPIVAPYAYLQGYNYNQGTAIIEGNPVTVSRDKGIPVTSLSWLKSKITDIGLDFSLFNGKLTGTLDYFYRKRTGLPAAKYDVIVPVEIGYGLPNENINTDAQYGEEMSLQYHGKLGQVNFNIGGNIGYTRSKTLDSYKPRFFNSWDEYRNSAENRFARIAWGYIADGQFTSQEQINNYPVNVDGQGNRTLIPGDIIYRDINGDNKIDGYDQRPIGYGYGQQPNINFGFSIGLTYKNFDFNADFSGGGGYTWFQNWETRWAFQNNGNLNTIFTDRWHRADMYDPNSEWVPGKYPANRYNMGPDHSNYRTNSTFWLHNVKQLRARTIQLGYTIPSSLLQRVKIQRARVYINAYNLFSLDNLKDYGIDPEAIDDNGLQFPQNRVINVGINLSL
ncbi:SusC/RagA family TonB-linked outer membrane protein [Foetidibacter luteolus]|uniref:SusC/RagA family TonB-linked outer membrane protein n=1 Tax=Foetidibacter luteolus TaxID=2608880 RepID=UPI00129A6648|nr:TonB-dependent receptor [Foetidibacter luteolus]